MCILARMDLVHSAPVPPRKSIQITLRLYEEDADRLEAIAKAMSGPGIEAAPVDAVRYVLARGYEPSERELGIKPTKARPTK